MEQLIKNISKAEVLTLKEQVSYQEGQVVSKTFAQNDAVSVTLFSFDKGEEISTHESGGDAFVTCLDGVGEITIDGKKYECMVEEIRKELNFTSLKFNRLDDMLDSVGIDKCKLCTYCWDGKE